MTSADVRFADIHDEHRDVTLSLRPIATELDPNHDQ
jgi:hypothetical protein